MDTSTIALVWNPSKTDRDVLETALDAALHDVSAEGERPETRWYETTIDDPGQGVAATAIAEKPDLLIAIGGDGTVRAVAQAIGDAENAPPLGIVPLGTGNLLARNLDVPLNNPRKAFQRALTGEGTPVDLGWVEFELDGEAQRHGFVVMVGFGIDAQMIVETDDELKKKAGWLAYVESLGRAVKASEVVEFDITLDDAEPRSHHAHTLLIANCGTLQGGISLIPDADPSDGELDLLILSADSVAQWMGTFKSMVWDNGLKRLISGSDSSESNDLVAHVRAHTVEVTLPHAHAFEIDGDDVGEVASFRVELQPAALTVR